MLAHSSPGVWALRGSPGGRARAMRALAALAAAAAQPLGHDVDVSTGLRRSSFSHGNFLAKLLAFWPNLANFNVEK